MMAIMWLFFGLLACFLWVVSDVTNSIIIHHHERNPLIVSWYQSFAAIIVLLFIGYFFGTDSSWRLSLFLSGSCAYVAYLFLLWLFHKIDVSVINAAWAFLSILVAAGGFLFFGERWSTLQSIGMILIVSGVFFLSYWHKHVSVIRTVFFLFILGALYTPLWLVQEAALLAGNDVVPVFFWGLLGHVVPMLIVPLCISRCRIDIIRKHNLRPTSFYALNVLALIPSILGYFSATLAYDIGYASLVGMTENAQPFFAILIAWIVIHLFPRTAPKELLTRQSVGIKIVSFSIVFAGMGMLAL